jgi:hypothetical protein
MITEKDLREAIAECEGERKPNANTCIKLAAYYTILDNLFGKRAEPDIPQYSMASVPSTDSMDYLTDSEFSQIVGDVGMERAYPVIDELMATLSVLNPKLYDGVMRKLYSL